MHYLSSFFLSFTCSLNFQIRKYTMDRSWSHEYRVPVALFILTPVTIVVIVLLVIRIDECPSYCRICQRGRFAAILAGNATISVPLVAPVKFRGTVSSRILLRLTISPYGLYTSRERWTGSAQIPREIDRFTGPRDYSPVDKVGEKIRRALSMYVIVSFSLSLYWIFSRVYRERASIKGICILFYHSSGADPDKNYQGNPLSKNSCHRISRLILAIWNKLIFLICNPCDFWNKLFFNFGINWFRTSLTRL